MLIVLPILSYNCYADIQWEINQTGITLTLQNKTQILWGDQGICNQPFAENIVISFAQDNQLTKFIYKSGNLPNVIVLKSWNMLTYTQESYAQVLMRMNRQSNISIQVTDANTTILGQYYNVQPSVTQILFDVKSESKAGLIAAVVIIIALIIITTILLVIKRKKQKKQKQQSAMLTSAQELIDNYCIEVNSVQEAQELFDEIMTLSRKKKTRQINNLQNKLQSINGNQDTQQLEVEQAQEQAKFSTINLGNALEDNVANKKQ